MSDWATRSIESIGCQDRPFAMGPFGSNIKTENFVNDGVPVIRGGNLRSNRLLDDDFVFLTEEKADELSSSTARSGDIVFTHRGTLGQVAMIPRAARYERYVVSQSQMRLRLDESIANPEFVTYWFQSRVGQHALLANAAQVGVPAIAQPLASLRSISIELPPLVEQRAIAGVLGALDDKIESNRRLMRLLEDESRLEFARQFRVAPVEDGIRLDSVVEINPKRALKAGTSSTYIAMANLPTSSALVDEWEVKPAGSGQRFTNGDVLLARITPCLENGKTALVDVLEDGEIGWGSTEYIVFAGTSGFSKSWVYCLARSEDFVEFAVRNMTGTSGRQRCPASAFDQYLIDPPDLETVVTFGKTFDSNFEQMGAARDESRRLAALRDALLPELLSGRLRVSDAEALLTDEL